MHLRGRASTPQRVHHPLRLRARERRRPWQVRRDPRRVDLALHERRLVAHHRDATVDPSPLRHVGREQLLQVEPRPHRHHRRAGRLLEQRRELVLRFEAALERRGRDAEPDLIEASRRRALRIAEHLVRAPGVQLAPALAAHEVEPQLVRSLRAVLRPHEERDLRPAPLQVVAVDLSDRARADDQHAQRRTEGASTSFEGGHQSLPRMPYRFASSRR